MSGGQEAKLAYCGNVLIENRNGLVVDAELLQANGTAERDAALLMAERIAGSRRVTVAADKGYDTKEFVREMRGMKVTPHVAQNDKRPGGSAIDSRTTRHAGYKVSQVKRKRIEEVFGWLKTVGMLRKTRHRGVHKVGWVFTFAAAAYNLVRMPPNRVQRALGERFGCDSLRFSGAQNIPGFRNAFNALSRASQKMRKLQESLCTGLIS